MREAKDWTILFMAAAAKFNLKSVQEPDNFKAIAEQDIGDRRVRLMLTGYSVAPDGYEDRTTNFVSSLVKLDNLAARTRRLSPARQRGSSLNGVGKAYALMRLHQRAKDLHWSKLVRAASQRVVQFAAIFD
jgi:hypothetical protein